jgi:hypothetical protein
MTWIPQMAIRQKGVDYTTGRCCSRRGGGVGRVIFTNNSPTSLFNSYTSGSGVGATSISARRALKRRASIKPGTMKNPHQMGQCCENKK